MPDDPIADRFGVFDQVTPPENWERVVAAVNASPRRARRVRRGVLAAAVLAVVVAAAVLAWPEREGGQPVTTTPGTTEPATPTTDTTEPAVSPPSVSSLDALTEAVLLDILVASPNGSAVAVFDLEARELREYPATSNRLPRGAISGAVLTALGDALVWSDGRIHVFADGDFTRTPVTVHPSEVVSEPGVAPGLRVVPTVEGDALWIVQPAEATPAGTVVDLVDIDTGNVLLHTNLPTLRAFPVDATAAGLILNAQELVAGTSVGFTEPGTDHVVAVDEAGALTDLGAGAALAAAGDTVAILSVGTNDLEVLSLETGTRRRVVAPRSGTWRSVGGPSIPGESQPLPTISADGRLLIAIGDDPDVNGEPAESTLYAVSLADMEAEPLAQFDGSAPLATWSRDARDVVLVTHEAISLLDRDDGDVAPAAQIPAGYFPLSAG